MANYKKITDVEVMEQVGENSMALVEDNGTLKKVPCGKGFGGDSIPTAIMMGDWYSLNLDPISTPLIAAPEPLTCINMTFEEAEAILRNRQPLNIIVMTGDEEKICHATVFPYSLNYSNPCIGFSWLAQVGTEVIDNYTRPVLVSKAYYWTADGITWQNPNECD